MLWIPQKGRVRVEHNLGAVGTATPGTSVTTGGATNTKGTPAELFAATSFDTYWVTILASNYFTGASDGAMDLLIGASTEAVLIADLLMGQNGNTGFRQWDFPLYIPAGSRLAVQAAGRRISTAFRVGLVLYGGDGLPKFSIGTKVTTYGMGTVPNGTAITPGASGAEGAWTQIVASTTEDHFALIPGFQVGNDASTNARTLYVDLGLGAATEEEIAQSYVYFTNASEITYGPFPSLPVFQSVPSGTRLAMRASNSGTNDGAYDGVIHAMS